jgi:hypothetical protein
MPTTRKKAGDDRVFFHHTILCLSVYNTEHAPRSINSKISEFEFNIINMVSSSIKNKLHLQGYKLIPRKEY